MRRGEAVGLLGPNGAGKTTVFYMITGLVRPEKGAIELDGYDVTALPMYSARGSASAIFRRRRRSSRLERRGQHPGGARSDRTRPGGARKRRSNSLLDEFDIARLRKAPSIALSGGERRRCEIARALAGKPSFMLLDEPFAGIDPIAVGDIQDLVRHLKGRGIGVLITDHNVRETLGLIDRAYIIHSGHVLTEGRRRRSSPIPTSADSISARISGCRPIAGRLLFVLAEPVRDEFGDRRNAASACAPIAETVIVEPRPRRGSGCP